MTLEELEKQADKAEAFAKEYGLGEGACQFVMPHRKHGLRGYRVRTPFGLCEILCESNSGVVFLATVPQIRGLIAKLKAQAAPRARRRAS